MKALVDTFSLNSTNLLHIALCFYLFATSYNWVLIAHRKILLKNSEKNFSNHATFCFFLVKFLQKFEFGHGQVHRIMMKVIPSPTGQSTIFLLQKGIWVITCHEDRFFIYSDHGIGVLFCCFQTILSSTLSPLGFLSLEN